MVTEKEFIEMWDKSGERVKRVTIGGTSIYADNYQLLPLTPELILLYLERNTVARVEYKMIKGID